VHHYAQERLAGYLATLREYGIDADPRWRPPPGPWASATGSAGIACLLDEQGLRPGLDLEAIVCASDQLALGALDALSQRGIAVPGQLALTGFNNIREARTHHPSLTTSAMPFQQQGRHALLRLLSRMGLPCADPGKSELIPHMVIGESCGCGNPLLQDYYGYGRAASPIPSEPLQSLLERHLQQLRTRPQAAALAQEIIAGLQRALSHDESGPLLQQILPLIRTGYFGLVDQVFWQQAFGAMRQWLPDWRADPAAREKAEASLEQLRQTVTEHYSREQGAISVLESKSVDHLRVLTAELALAETLPSMMDQLCRGLQLLNVHSCWLALYEDPPQQGRAPQRSRLTLAMERGQRFLLDANGVLFPSHDLIPAGYRQQNQADAFILAPVMHGEIEYGFLILNQSASTNYYETLASAIGSAIRQLSLREQLESRTLQLERSYQELVSTQKRLVEADKMAALGELVAGVAHEINTPLGVGVTAVSTLQDETGLLAELVERRQGKAIPAVLRNLQESARIAMRNLERAVQLIESFKQIAVDQTRSEVRTFNLASYLEDVALSVSPRLKSGGHRVEIACPPDIELTCDPSIIARILTNLMINSLQHGFEQRHHGLISLICERQQEQIIMTYRDDGAGMAAETLKKMFNPFFTTKRGRGGTGLGMHIAYNLVVQGLGGQIEAQSQPEQGVRFRISFPAHPPA